MKHSPETDSLIERRQQRENYFNQIMKNWNNSNEQENHSPPKRTLRTRKLNQLKPFTTESRKYITTLHHNGWEDAVIKLPKHPHRPRSPPLSINGSEDEPPLSSPHPSSSPLIQNTTLPTRHKGKAPCRNEEEEEEEEPEEEEEEEETETVLPRKVKLKLLNRMMPRVYVAKAEKDLRLMEQEKRAGKMKLTIDSDSSDCELLPPRKNPPLSPSRTSRLIASSSRTATLNSSSSSSLQQREQPGITWGARMNNSSFPDAASSQLSISSPTLQRSNSRASSTSSRISQITSSRPPTRVVSQSRQKVDHAISLKDDHALWKTYESANGRPALNLPPPGWPRREGLRDDDNLAHVPIWDFKDFTPDFAINRLPANLTVTSQVAYLSEGHVSELISVLDGSSQCTLVDPVEIFGKSLSGFMTREEWHQHLSSGADQIHDELMAWLAEDSDRSKDALLQTAKWFRFMGRSISSSLGFDDALIETMVDWIENFLVRVDDLAVDAVNRSEFSNLMLVASWGIFELVLRLDLRHRRRPQPLDSSAAQPLLAELGQRSLSNLVRRLLEYGPPVTMGKLKAYIASLTDHDVPEGPLFDVSVEIWAALLNIIIITPRKPTAEDDSEYLLSSHHIWTTIIDATRIHSRRIELSQMACGEAISYLSMMMCALSQIMPTGQTTGESRMVSHWPILVDSLGKIPETILGETLDQVRMRERRDRYIRALFTRILIFHQRWDWPLSFDDGMIERLYKILNSGRLERLSIELPEMNHRFGAVDAFPHILDIDDNELMLMSSPEDILFALDTQLRADDSCFGMFLKILVIAFKALPRPIEPPRQKEIEKIISRCNPLRQLTFKPSRELGPTDPKISDQNRTSLVNHASLFVIYSILFPNTLKRQWSFLNNLYSFSNIDHPARSTHFKILSQFVKFLKPPHNANAGMGHFDYLKMTVKRFAENMNLLKLEYSRLKDRESTIQGRLFGSTAVNTTTTTTSSSSLTSRDIFKKDSVELVTLNLELKDITNSLTSRIQLIVRIFQSLQDLFSFFSCDLTRDRLGDHPLIYPSLFWLDPAWTVGLEDSSLIKEKKVMSALQKYVGALLEGRRKKMGQVKEDERRVLKMEARLQEEEEAQSRLLENWDEQGVDPELVMEKNELKESIASVYEQDREWISQAIGVLPRLLAKSIHGFMLNQHLDEHGVEDEQEEDGFLTVGVELIRLLGILDRLKAAVDPGFDWMQNLRAVDQQFGAGISSRPGGEHLQGKTSRQHKNGLRLMTVGMTGMMGYLLGNLGAYYQEAEEGDVRTSGASPSGLARLYRGEVRLRVVRVWMESLTHIEYTLQLPFSSLIVLLEAHAQACLHDPHELFGAFVPPLDAWNAWLLRHRLVSPSLTTAPSSSLLVSSDPRSAKAFESKRAELFDLIFGEMKRHLDAASVADGGSEMQPGQPGYVRLYKEVLGGLAEAISTMNRRLGVLVSAESAAGSLKDPARTPLHLRLPPPSRLRSLVLHWKLSLSSILAAHLPLHLHPPFPPHHPLISFFNFSSFPKLRILKSFLGIP